MENKYLTYEKYKGLGGNIPLMSFERVEYKAEKYIDTMTAGRFNALESYPKELEMCVYDLIENFYKEEVVSNIASESDGNYSVTYRTESKEDSKNSTKDIVKMWLTDTKVNGVPVLYCGADE